MRSEVLTQHHSSRRRREVLAPAVSVGVLINLDLVDRHEQIDHLLFVAAIVTSESRCERQGNRVSGRACISGNCICISRHLSRPLKDTSQ
jgi:hypothetical protein